MVDPSLAPGELPWEGGCRCDRVRFRIVAAPIVSAICHCRGCQRMSSSAFSLTLMVPRQGVELLQGETVPGGARTELQHEHCDYCKTWVRTIIPEFGVINVRATLLDQASWFVPYLETYLSTRLPWVTSPAIQSYDEFPAPDSYPELMAGYASWARERGWPIPNG